MKKLNLFTGLRDFLILWVSQTVSTLGTAMTNFALIIWVYEQKGTASSITLLSICSFLPTILFRFIAGTIADRWDKKRIMLLADVAAACGTVTVFILHSCAALQIWHLHIINFLLSFMDAFQSPAAYVATTLLVPKEQYVRVSGLYAFSGSIMTILASAFGSALMAFGGLKTVLAIDLVSFAVAFLTLLFFIKIPDVERSAEEVRESFRKSCMSGINFLREHSALLRIILFFAFINFIAKIGTGGMLPALILGRTNGDQVLLGIVEATVGIGALVGSILVTLIKPVSSRTKVIFIACGLSFILGEFLLSFGQRLPLWVFSAFAYNLPLPFLGANLTAIMRTKVPIEMQGRVSSAQSTIQNGTIPLGFFLGGVLADHIFEPFMAAASPLQETLSVLFGTGGGSGIALMFCIVGIIGFAASFWCLRNPIYRSLDDNQ